MGGEPIMVWHRDSELPKVDLVVVPGGFSYGDYLRCGAIAAHSPVMREGKARAAKGMAVLGVCNGFQIITEAGLLPGILLRNASLKFACRNVGLRVENSQTLFTSRYEKGQVLSACTMASCTASSARSSRSGPSTRTSRATSRPASRRKR